MQTEALRLNLSCGIDTGFGTNVPRTAW